jgi:hypothetical protein
MAQVDQSSGLGGILLALCVSGFGVLLLAIRRPNR